MSDKFLNKYRIASARLKNWDYGSNATYFVTICTKNRKHFFGEIRNQEMYLNDVGKMVESEWIKSFELRSDMNLYMGEFQVMTNHFHGIVGIGANRYNTGCAGRTDAMHRVSTFGPQSKNLGSIMRGFKSAVTVGAKLIIPDFGWQERFHDHIIRDKRSFHRISEYIKNNPKNWRNDRFLR